MVPFEKFFRNKKSEVPPASPAPESTSAASAQIHQLLSARSIALIDNPGKKAEVLKHLVKLISDEYSEVSLERAYQAVMEREKVTSTFMDSGIGVPHARLPKIDRIYAALGILQKGFSDQKDTTTSFVFLFLSPAGDFTAHLQILSRASWLFQNAALKEKLLASRDIENVLHLIKTTEEQSTHGPKA